MLGRWSLRRLRGWAVAFVVFAPTATPAHATETQTELDDPRIACLNQHEQAQLSRNEGRLLEARAKLLLCSLASCPPAIRADCVDWIEQVNRSLPSVVVTARAHGQDVANVQVFVDDKLVAERLTGAALDLDPGEHRFRFESPPWPALNRTILVSEGVKGRVIDIELAPAPPAPASQASVQPSPPPPLPPVVDHHPRAFNYALGGVALASLGTFAVAGTWALIQRHELQEDCAPFCSADQVSSVSTKLLIADVALAAAAVSLAVLYFRLSEPGGSRQTSQASNLVPVAQATSQGAAVGVGGRF
jgi:hypothetical protein